MSRSPIGPTDRRAALWWLLVVGCVIGGFVLRVWNLDFDERQHLHPDERYWSLVSADLAREPAPPEHGTLAGPVLDWLDGDRSPANPYRVTPSFVYGPSMLAASRATAGWLHDGAVTDAQPASTVVHLLDDLGIPLLDAQGAPRFDDGYGVDLIGRLLGAIIDSLTIVVIALAGRRLAGRRAGLAAGAFQAGSVLAIQHAHFLGSEPLLGLCSALTVLAMLHLDRGGSVKRAAITGVAVGAAAGATVAAKLSGAAVAVLPLLLAGALVVIHRRRSDLVRFGAIAIGAIGSFRVIHPAAFNGLGMGLSRRFLDDVAAVRGLDGLDSPPAVQWAGRIPVLEPLRWLVVFTVGPGAAVAATLGAVWLVRRRGSMPAWNVAAAISMCIVPIAFVLRNTVTSGRYFVPSLPALHVLAGAGAAALWAAAPAVSRAARVVAAGTVVAALLWGIAFVAGVHGQDNTRIAASKWIAANVEPGSVISAEAWDDALPLAVDRIDPGAYESLQLDLFATDNADKVERVAAQLAELDLVVESSPRVWDAVTRIPARYPSTIRLFDLLDSGALGFERAVTFDAEPGIGPFRLADASAEEAFSVYDHPEVRIWRRVATVPVDEIVRLLDPAAAANALPVTPTAASANGLLLHDDELRANAEAGTYSDTFADRSGWIDVALWFLVVEVLGAAAFVVLLPALRRLPDAGAGLAKIVGLAIPAFAVFLVGGWTDVPITSGLFAVVAIAFAGVAGWRAWRTRSTLLDVLRSRRRTIVLVEVLGVGAFATMLVLRAANPDLWHPYRSGEKPFELSMFTAVLRTRTLPPYDAWFAGGTMNYYYGGYLLMSVPARLARTAPAVAMNLAVAVVAWCAAGASFTAAAAVAAWRRGSESAQRRSRRAGVVVAVLLLALPNMAIVAPVVRRLAGTETGNLDWWALSRVIPGSQAITEFPAWSFLFADLHPHLVDLPVVLAVAGLCLAWAWNLRHGSTAVALWLAALLGMMCGFVRAINTWDLPLALGLVALAAAMAVATGADRRRTLLSCVVVAAVAFVAWAPYGWRSEVFDAGVDALHDSTPLRSWLMQFGFFAVVSVITALAAHRPTQFTARALAMPIGALATTLVIGVASGRIVLVVTAFLAVVCVVTAVGPARRRGGAGSPIAHAALAVGWGVQAVVELVVVRNDFDRQNTVFKGWFQSWTMLAIGSGVLLAGLMTQRSAAGGARRNVAMWSARTALISAALAVTAFAQLAVPARLDDRISNTGWSLDGEDYLRPGLSTTENGADFVLSDDVPLVEWLRRHVAGVVPVAEAPGEDYRWTGRISVLTGLPSPIGWRYHEEQQRRTYAAAVNARHGEMAVLFSTDDQAVIVDILDRMRVEYVVFGTQERLLSTPASRTALLEAPCTTIELEVDDLFITSVDRACLAARN